MQNFDDPFREETLDLQKTIRKHLHLWPWFALSLMIALGAAWLKNAYKQNIYENQLTLLIFDDNPLLELNQSAFSSVSVSDRRIQNEIGILTSRTLIRETIESLDFFVEYHLEGKFVDQELYPNPYFYIEIDSLWPQPLNVPLRISRSESGQWNINAQWKNASLYNFSHKEHMGRTGETSKKIVSNPGQWIELPYMRFRIGENPGNIPGPDQHFLVYFREINTLVSRYRGLNVSVVPNSTMLAISVRGKNRNKNEAFLNMHAQKFLRRELDKKNLRAQKTIDFIEQQLVLVSQSLYLSESHLEDFRTTEQVLNFDQEAQRTFARMEKLQQEKARLLIKDKYYQYLANYLTQVDEDGSDLIAPSSLGVDDPLLSNLIRELMNLYTERSELLINSRRENPFLTNLEGRIMHTKKTALESLKNIIRANNMAIADLDERIKTVNERINLIPESQRNLLNIERQFHLHETLYKLLQSKKSEIEIHKAGFTPVHEVVDPALASDGRIVSAQTRMTYYMGAFVGLLLPVLLIFLYEFFNDKIRTSEDIEKLDMYPFLGHIARNPQKEKQLISYDSHSLVAESFRSLRTNTQFVLPPDDIPVIMITSTLLGEGKTFVSLNMAAGYASLRKKVILLSFDLRKPKLHKYLDMGSDKGLSNYLSSEMTPPEIICKSPVPHMDIIFSGQIPPNPAELLNSPKVASLFQHLKNHYDYILVDTPPAGMVADSLLLIRHVNVVIYLIRHNTTPFKYLQHTLRNLKQKEIKNLNLVINDMPPPGRFSYYGSYGYQYGYFEKK